jgi:L-malate glycosyltransferase
VVVKISRRVTIFARTLPIYRIAFYEALRQKAANCDIDLDVVIGQPSERRSQIRDIAELPWAMQVRNRYMNCLGAEVYWQPLGRRLYQSALIIAPQSNSALANYPLLITNAAKTTKVAFWGHGRNFQSETHRWRDCLKEALAVRVHWWFTYNEASSRVIRDLGFPSDRITCVENAVDTAALGVAVQSVTTSEIYNTRRRLGMTEGPIGLYVGALYDKKRIPFLLEAASRIRSQVPGFQLVVIGSGPSASLVRHAAGANSWIKYLGPLHGIEKATYLKMADVMLMPGLVGLAILDSFVGGTPMITRAVDYHSPEIDYLADGVNGRLVTDLSLDAYVNAVAEILLNGRLRTRLNRGCSSAAGRYTIDNMAERFAAGIVGALDAKHLSHQARHHQALALMTLPS